MGKKVKKTRWRALTLDGQRSDSEESCTSPGNNCQRKYTKFSYSSHSSPIRSRFEHHESTKTTRSNSTTSDKKATFNEDEYTRITTPRQDVLFKKGYLNKPKMYQTQTSTGTCSTANSTSTCTPDHQSADGMESADLEYESQFVFPNGFIDQNGIYYVNSFEPFPFVVYNAPICYAEHPNARTKRYSTDSMAESVSPQNEESGIATTQPPSDEERSVRLKRRRRRKVSPSKSITSDASSDDVFKTEKDATKYELKPDAEEFIPRNLQTESLPFDPNVHFFNVQHNFIPVPFVNGDIQTPFVPVNFIPPAQSYVNVAQEAPPVQEVRQEIPEVKKKTDIDIAKIVWKLEEAAKEQGTKSFNRQPKARTFQRPRFNRFQNRERQTKTDGENVAGWKPKTVPLPIDPIEKKTEIKVVTSQVRSPRKSNQWIAVANRKKRKNKPAEDAPLEEPAEEEETPALNDDLFESFDVSQLIDVVPRSQHATESTPGDDVEKSTITDDIVEPPKVDGMAEVDDVTQPTVVEHISKTAEVEDDPPQAEAKKKKKKSTKAAIKKVMVTDLPLPQKPEENITAAVSAPSPEGECTIPDVAAALEEQPCELPEKKKKKKKKPTSSPKPATSSSTANCVDSYDFLLENSSLADCEEKTNVEISREFDRMIQKGICNSLEEKIRAMNIDLDASFFATLSKSEPSTATATTPSRGVFQWNLQEFQDKGENNRNGPNHLTNVQNFSVPSEPFLRKSLSPPLPPPPMTSYPITRAVKDWMTKTRENTPDVEIFKSPNAIYRELCDDESGEEADDEDVIIWSANEIESKVVEDCEEAIEVYESRYGNNEDYLKIRGEVEAQRENLNSVRRGNDLPYRAICCNLM